MNHFLSLDLETTGTTSDEDQILEIGAVIDDGKGNVHDKPMFQCYITYPVIHGSAYALAMNAEILNVIADRNQDPELPKPEVMGLMSAQMGLLNFINEHHKLDQKITATGKNFGSFDLQFLKHNMPLVYKRIRHRVIDPANLWWDYDKDGFDLPNTDEMNERAGITPCLHRALDDAIDTCIAVRRAIGLSV